MGLLRQFLGWFSGCVTVECRMVAWCYDLAEDVMVMKESMMKRSLTRSTVL